MVPDIHARKRHDSQDTGYITDKRSASGVIAVALPNKYKSRTQKDQTVFK